MSAAATTLDPTVAGLRKLRLNAVCPYYTMYPLGGILTDAGIAPEQLRDLL